MKRFLVFSLICIVVLSITLTAFFIVKDDEVITVTKLYYQVNLADSINIEVEIENQNLDTEMYYEVIEGQENVSYSEASGSYIAQNAGAAAFLITSSNTNFIPVTVNVEIGSGIEEAPLFIKTVEDLKKIGNDINNFFSYDKYYKLTNDISLSGLEWTPIAPTEADAFTGGFDFNGYTISDLTITTDMDNAGLFGVVGEDANIKGVSVANSYAGVSLSNVNIAGDFVNTGAVAGINKGTIERVVVNGEVNNTATTETSRVGGIAGYLDFVNTNTTISRCGSEIDVKGRDYIGGITAENNSGIIINSYSSGELTGGNVNSIVGGITATNIGRAVDDTDYKRATIKDCYSIATIAGVTEDWAYVTVENLNPSDVLKNNIVGTYYLTESFDISEGVLRQDNVINSTGDYVNVDGTVEDVVETYPELGVYGKSAEELKNPSTFFSHVTSLSKSINWDFGNVWQLDSKINNGYPSLILNGAFVNNGLSTLSTSDVVGVSTLETIRMDVEDRKSIGKNYVMSEDIDLGVINNFIPIGTEEKPFQGSFYAINGAKIINLTIENKGNVGLFGYVSEDAIIDGLTIINPKLTADFYLGVEGEEGEIIYDYANVGTIAGVNDGVIQNCIIREEDILNENLNRFIETGEVTGDESTATLDVNLGGVVGVNNKTISGCSTEIIVKAETANNRNISMGGVAGLNKGSINSRTNTSGKIILEGNGFAYVGGIAGQSYGMVDYCYSTIFTTASTTGKNYIGGLIGRMVGGVLTKSTSGAEQGSGIEGAYVGGLVGVVKQDADYSEDKADYIISECYSNVQIKANQAGGLVYKLENGVISDCYSLSSIEGEYSTSITAGFIVEMPNGDLKNSISYTDLTVSRGNAYTEVYTSVRSSTKYGILINTMYDTEKVGIDAIETVANLQDSEHSGIVNKIIEVWNKVEGAIFGNTTAITNSTSAIGITTEGISGTIPAGFNDGEERIWEVVVGEIPKLINVASVYVEETVQ